MLSFMKFGSVFLVCCVSMVIYLLLYYFLIIRSRNANKETRVTKNVLMFVIGWILSVLSSILALFLFAVYVFESF